MLTVRQGTFETNSSSTHSITMCTESDFNAWGRGELYFDRWNDELVTKEVVEEDFAKLREEFINKHPDFDENDEEWLEELDDFVNDDKQYYTREQYFEYIDDCYETYEDRFTTSNGETVIAFGYYGYN